MCNYMPSMRQIINSTSMTNLLGYCDYLLLLLLLRTYTFRACHLCTFIVTAIFFGAIPTHGVLLYAMITLRVIACSAMLATHMPDFLSCILEIWIKKKIYLYLRIKSLLRVLSALPCFGPNTTRVMREYKTGEG